MTWNWQQADWPHFTYKNIRLIEIEGKFNYDSGVLFGAYSHIKESEKGDLIIDLISDEAINTSEIEGEYLNRDSVQSSIRRHFGLEKDNRKIPAAEQGIAEMMLDLYDNFSDKLTHNTLYKWHAMIMKNRRDLNVIGAYRTHDDPMQVISGPYHNLKIHFEAPPSKDVFSEMDRFISWFNDTTPQGKNPLSPLIRASIAHLYFVCIHPFEDGNGRIARAIAEKALSECIGQPTLISLSNLINQHKKIYYEKLEGNNKINEITSWVEYFSEIIVDAQRFTLRKIFFLIEKTKLFDKIRGQLNLRQEKVINRMFREGIDGFKGGLSAENYISITNTSRASATRDLQDLVDKAALRKTGERKTTRYYLNIN